MVNRPASASVGCLVVVVILAIAAYVGVHVGAPYYRYYQFRDAVQQEARFATLRGDSTIRQDIWANADSLALPEGAYRVFIYRNPHAIRIRTAYDDSWSLGMYRRPVHFTVDVDNSL